jgi:predicted RNase H-like HicB family nuclease
MPTSNRIGTQLREKRWLWSGAKLPVSGEEWEEEGWSRTKKKHIRQKPSEPLMRMIEMIKDEEKQMIVAEAPELPGCVAHGDTEESALKNVKDAIDLWIDTAHECGDPIPKPKGIRLMYG